MCEVVYSMETPCENPSTVIAKEMCRHVKGLKVSYLLSFGTFLFLENRKKLGILTKILKNRKSMYFCTYINLLNYF